MIGRGGAVLVSLAVTVILSLPVFLGFRGDAAEAKLGFKEERWVFDFMDKNIRFSHGSHKTRDRWFKIFFGEGYHCGACHNTSLPVEGPEGVKLTDGEPLTTVEEIREHQFFPFPYGVKMTTCLSSCHNDKIAPGNCDWCHVPGSKPLVEKAPAAAGSTRVPLTGGSAPVPATR